MGEDTLNRYAVFSGYEYYPSGGWYDFRGSYPTAEEAIEVAKERDGKDNGDIWAHAIDLHTGGMIYG